MMRFKTSITIKHDRLIPNKYSLLYFGAHLLFLLIMYLVPVLPYFTYDDLNIYSVYTIKDLSLDYFKTRQIFIYMCCYLNSWFPGEIINGPRLFNIVLFYFSIREVVRLCKIYGYDENTIRKITLFLIISPQYLIISCSMIKDVLTMYCVLRSVRGLLNFTDKEQQNMPWFCFVLIVLYFTRFGLLELIAIIFAITLIMKSKHKVVWLTLLSIVIAYGVYKILANQNYVYLLNQKLDFMASNKSTEEGFMNYLRINSPNQIYRLIFALPYMLLLGVPNIAGLYEPPLLWLNIIGFFSFITLFLLPSFYSRCISIIKGKNKNELMSLGYFAAYHILIALTSPSLFRYLFCIAPFFVIFSIRELSVRELSDLTKNHNLKIAGGIFSLLYVLYLVIQLIR